MLPLLFYLLFLKKVIFPPAQSPEVTITLDLQSFESIHSEKTEESMQEKPEQSQDTLAKITKEISEEVSETEEELADTLAISDEIEESEDSEVISAEEATRRLFEKIANSQKKPKPPKEKKSIEKKVDTLEKAKLAEIEQEKLVKEKRIEEEKAKALEQKKLAQFQEQKQLEEERKKELAFEKAILAEIAQEKLVSEQRKEKIMQAQLAQLEKEQRLQAKKIEEAKIAKKKEALKKAALKKEAEKKRLEKKRKKKEKLAKQKKQRLAKEALRKKKLKEQEKAQSTLTKSIAKSSSTLSKKQNKSDAATKMINKFYGSEFNSFSNTQKKFIRKNLGTIYRITQRTLTRNGYPEVAARTQQQGTQLVTFYLHPNGQISGLRYKRNLGYASLDKNTMNVIKIAYKNYPRPKTKTKITFYVEYSLF